MQILEALPRDAQEILKLQKLACISEAELHGDFKIPPLTQTSEELIADFDIKTFLKVIVEAEIVASGQVYVSGNSAYIGRMAVKPEFQGRGIGSQLMSALESVYSKVQTFEVFTGENSARNLGMYKRGGYSKVKSRFWVKQK